jgi:signal peptidase I
MAQKVKELRREPIAIDTGDMELKVSVTREYFVTIVTCLILALFVTTFVIHPMSVPTESMVPTILVGDRLIVDKFLLRTHSQLLEKLRLGREIKRGDVIVFKYPGNPEMPYVKRVIGLPGETVEVRNKEVYINNEKLNDPYGHFTDRNTEMPHRDQMPPLTIKADGYFVMGDNRDNSADSRYWGTVPKDYIIGRPLFIFWSYEDPPYHVLVSQGPLKIYASRILNFFTKTRWRRMGKQIK